MASAPQAEGRRPNAGPSAWSADALWDRMRDLPGVRSWRFLSDAVFLSLSLPIGLFWFILLLVLGVVGLSLSVVLVGLLILAAMVALTRRGAQFERRRVRTFLGETIPAPYRPRTGEGGWWRRRT